VSPELCGADEDTFHGKTRIKDLSPMAAVGESRRFPVATTTHAHTHKFLAPGEHAAAREGKHVPPAAGVIREPLPELHRTQNSMTFCSTFASSFLNAPSYAVPLGFEIKPIPKRQPLQSRRLALFRSYSATRTGLKPFQPMRSVTFSQADMGY
jgi:hypothetical protein